MRDGRAALEYSVRAEALATEYGHPLYLGMALRSRGVAEALRGAHDDAEEFLRRSLEQFSALGTRWQAGRTWSELGWLEAVRGRPEKADGCYRQALALFEAMGARPDAERTRLTIESLGRL